VIVFQGVGSTYNQQAVYSIIPATATHGSNMVYQQSAPVSDSMVRGDASGYYYPPTYMQMPSGGVHHITAASGCPVPGILVQGPPPMQLYSASTNPQQEAFQSGNGAARGKTDCLRSGHPQPTVQVYVPPGHSAHR